ncbi:MAG: redox-regulated ATPase YchF [Patescibacteria group bacterium]
MSFSIGIVGLPNVGKSTLFKALTRQPALIANYPFATIDPNVGIVAVPDERLQKLAEVSKSAKIVPTTIEFVDIAGLVKGAAQGEGLGNKFLSHIREVSAIAQVVREFSDLNIIHVAGAVNPKNDFEIINTELALADLEQATRHLREIKNKARAGINKTLEKEILLFEKIVKALGEGRALRDFDLDDEEKKLIKSFCFLTAKPMMVVVNCDEDSVPSVIPVKTGIQSSNSSVDILDPRFRGDDNKTAMPVVRISAKIEAELADLSLEEAAAFLASAGQKQSGLDKIILAGYELLTLLTFLTAGPDETRAWTIPRGTKAPQAAGVIHSDFEKGFIRAEICDWQDFVKYNGEAGIKSAGLWRLEGKEYVMKDGDVCYFRSAV